MEVRTTLIALDLDGTIDSDPASFQSLMAALQAAGHVVAVLTGCSKKHPDAQDLADKANYLTELGCGHCYDTLVVFGDPPHKAKAKWLKKHGASFLIDNSVKNAKAAGKHTTVLLPWNTRTGGKER